MTTTPTSPAAFPAPAFAAAKYIKEIGRGVNGARALPREDAQALFDAMLAGRVADIELGAVLMAYRIKGEAPHELAGMLDAAHAHCLPLAGPADRVVVSIPSYNGARKQPNLVPLLALLLAREGIPVLVHGSRQFNGRVTSISLFEALGIVPCSAVAQAESQLRSKDAQPGPLAVLPIDVLSPALARMLDKRMQIGLRNSAHTVVKMLQPVGAHSPAEALRLYSYTHPEYRETLTDYSRASPPMCCWREAPRARWWRMPGATAASTGCTTDINAPWSIRHRAPSLKCRNCRPAVMWTRPRPGSASCWTARRLCLPRSPRRSTPSATACSKARAWLGPARSERGPAGRRL